MRRLDIDDDLLAEAKEVLGTHSNDETVNNALREAVDVVRRRQLLVHLVERGNDILDPEVAASAWR